MLTKLPIPAYSSIALYSSMLQNADSDDLNELKGFATTFSSACAAYDQHGGSSAHIVPLTTTTVEFKTAIDNCYKRLGNKQITPSYLRDLLIHAVPRCPYCGIGETAVLDHVLPRSVWPEFTIHIRNLVPACGKCNGHKSNRSFLISNWSYRHPYFDSELTEHFLFARPLIRGKNIRYEFWVAQPSKLSATTFLSIEKAFETFDLANRFSRQSVATLSDRSYKLKQLFKDLGAVGVKEYLLGESLSLSHSRGPNHWEAVLFRDLAANVQYCNFQHWS